MMENDYCGETQLQLLDFKVPTKKHSYRELCIRRQLLLAWCPILLNFGICNHQNQLLILSLQLGKKNTSSLSGYALQHVCESINTFWLNYYSGPLYIEGSQLSDHRGKLLLSHSLQLNVNHEESAISCISNINSHIRSKLKTCHTTFQ